MTAIRLTHLHHKGRADDHPVAWRDGQLLTWGEYHGRVAQLCAELAPRPEQRWLLTCEDPLDFAIGLFALWHAGKIAVIPPSLRPGALDSLDHVADARLDTTKLGAAHAPVQQGAALPPLDPILTRLELYTSGSTGQPKQVPKSLAQLDNEVMVLEQVWGRRAAPTLATVPHHHIYGLLFRLLWPLAGGRPFDSETCATPEQLLSQLDRLGPAMVVSSPSQLARMPELIDVGLLRGKATSLFSSGGPLAAEAATRFHRALGEAPLEIYGSTETGGIAWRQQHDGDDAWTLQPGVALHLGADGTLTLTSPFLPDASPMQTGDAAKWLEDGRFRLLGRTDRIAKIEEKRLSLPELEARLGEHAWVKEAAALVLTGRRQTVGAILVLNDAGRAKLAAAGRAAVSRELRLHLAHWYDAVLLPRHWRYPEALPYNERGKLTQADLQTLFADMHDA
jgi:acyl-coenzyme A synthetase/AMP-(fatty) acid ligase